MRRILTLVLVIGLCTGCAANGKMTMTEDRVHDALARVDDNVRTVCTGADAERLKPVCTDVRSALIPTLEAGAAFNRAVAAQKVSALAPLVEAVGRLVTAVKALPQGQVGQLVVDLADAVAAAFAEVKR